MAFSPIAYIAPNYRDYKNWWLKAYEPSTTTPKGLALNADGTGQVAKLELNKDGFLVSSGDALVIPYVDGIYDLWLFPTEAEADANDTANAERVADNLKGTNQEIEEVKKYGQPVLLSQAVADENAQEGDTVIISDRGNGLFEYKEGQTPNETWIVECTGVPALSLVLQWSGALNPVWFGADPTGVAECAGRINAALALDADVKLPVGKFLISSSLQVQAGQTLTGAGSGNYEVQGAAERLSTTIVVQSNTATNGVVVASKGTIRDIAIEPENLTAVQFYDANYPAGTGNAGTGLVLGDNGGSANAENITVRGFANYGCYAETTSKINRCHFFMNDVGLYFAGADGHVTNSVAMFNMTKGMEGGGNYIQWLNNRVEWNARTGLEASGESTITGNVFDRNGWFGLFLKGGSWGQAITGNTFTRNGAGGDGTIGRWGFSLPTHPSYLETPKEFSAHIGMDYMRNVSIVGQRYRAGSDDADQGVNSPCYIYSSLDVDNATSPDSIEVMCNAGEDTPENPGYNPVMYSNSGAIAGGSDGPLADYFNLYRVNTRKVHTRDSIGTTGAIITDRELLWNSPATVLDTNTVIIDIPKGATGKVLLAARGGLSADCAEVFFSTNAGGAGYGTAFTNVIGTPVSSVTYATKDAEYDLLTINLSGNYFTSYTVTAIA